MNRIKEIMNQITKKAWIISIIILVLIGIVFIVWPFSIFKKDNTSEKVDIDVQEFIAEATDQIFIKEDSDQKQYQNKAQSIQEVRIAVVIDEASQKVVKDAKKTSCGDITFVTMHVSKPAILTNSIKAMFEGDVAADFVPGNIIPLYHPELTFEKVILKDGIAKIYLNGNFAGTHDGWCDANLAITQIVETAKTFSTVTSVEVYQGEKKIY